MTSKIDFCRHCQYRIKSQEEAARILRDLIRQAHMQTIGQGGTLIEAHLDEEMTVRLCLWEEGCEDCEDSHDAEVETWPERDSQNAVADNDEKAPAGEVEIDEPLKCGGAYR